MKRTTLADILLLLAVAAVILSLKLAAP